MARRIIYKENVIIAYGEDDFHAFYENEDGDVDDKVFTSLEKAQEWIDKKSSPQVVLTIQTDKYFTADFLRQLANIIEEEGTDNIENYETSTGCVIECEERD